ncbi:MAG: ABC transporter permease [Azospirillaceae bacterium]
MTTMTENIAKRRKRPTRRRQAFTEAGYRTASLIGALLIWELLVWYSDVPVYFIPAPSDIGEALWRGADLYANHYFITLGRTVSAFVIAILVGITMGTLVNEIRLVNRTVYPILVSMQSMPKIALAPVVIVWFGFGSLSKIVLGAFAAFFPIYLNTMHGLKTMDSEQLALMRSLGATRWQTFWKVKLPSALPFLLAGANIGIIYATLAVIVGEFIGANSGMGFLIINQSNQLDTAGVFANILILSATGLCFHYGIHYLREKIIFWN